MINLKACRKTPTINVGVNPVTNVHVSNSSVQSRSTQDATSVDVGPTMARYPPDPEFVSVTPQPCVGLNRAQGSPSSLTGQGWTQANPKSVTSFTADMSALQSDDPEKAKLLRENAVLKLIIDIQHNNPLIFNKYIIADDATLIRMVALLCNASEVHIDADDVGRGCISKNIYRKVHSIYVVVNGETLNLKYNFSDVMKTLKDLHISTKWVF